MIFLLFGEGCVLAEFSGQSGSVAMVALGRGGISPLRDQRHELNFSAGQIRLALGCSESDEAVERLSVRVLRYAPW